MAAYSLGRLLGWSVCPVWLSETWSALAQALQGYTWKGSPRLLIDVSLKKGAWARVRASLPAWMTCPGTLCCDIRQVGCDMSCTQWDQRAQLGMVCGLRALGWLLL